MVSEPSGQSESPQEREPPRRRPPIIRIFSALKRYENRRRRRTKQEKSDRDLIIARWTRRVGIFTAALVVVGIATGGIFWRQLNIMRGQLNEMKTAGVDTRALANAAIDQAKAAKQSAETNRAYFFTSYDIPQVPMVSETLVPSPDRPRRFFIIIKYSISNVGQTPGIITDIDSHLLVDAAAPSLFVAPSPDTDKWEESRETHRQLTDAMPGVGFGDGGKPIFRIFVSGNSTTKPITETFTYEMRPYSVWPVSAMPKWLYVKISFLDIYMRQHWSCFYARLSGTAAQPVAGVCNDWD